MLLLARPLSRARTPHAASSSCSASICLAAHCSSMRVLVDDLYPYDSMVGRAHEQKAYEGAVDRRGQQKCNVCDAHGFYQMIRSIILAN